MYRHTLPLVALVLVAASCNGKGEALDPCEACEEIGASPRYARLTHGQYTNAVQSVLGLPSAPTLAESFIGDGLSEGGFDNDGGRLQVGGELWSDYQRAAETLASRVVRDPNLYAGVVPEDEREGITIEFEERFEAEGGGVDATTGRATGSGWNLWSNGSLTAEVEVPADGPYTVSSQVWANQAGPDLANAELLVDGAVLGDFNVEAASFGNAEVIAIDTELSAGTHRIGVAFTNDYYQAPDDRNLHVDWVGIAGSTSVADDEAQIDEAAARAWITRFGAQVHRRPLTEEQVEAYVELFQLGAGLEYTGDGFRDGVYTVLQAMLQSPWFVYRTELSRDQDAQGRVVLDGWDLASKLSFAVTHAPPDRALVAAAADGSLLTDEGYAAQVDRLLQSSEADPVIDHFHRQLLNLDYYENIYKDPGVFPQWSPRWNRLMQDEALLFTRSVVRDGEGVRDFYTSPRTYANRDLGEIYGLRVDSDELIAVDLDSAQRAGVLTLSGFLASQAHANEIDSIHRGAFVGLRLVCASLPPPPNVIPPLPEPIPGQTNRERVELHTGEGTCGSTCHGEVINPLGFATENYDAIGRWRDTDVGKPVDASGSYGFQQGAQSWTTPAEFAQVVGDSTDAHECLTRHWMAYLHGRNPTDEDERVIARVGTRSHSQDLALQDVMRDLLLDDAFRFRAPEVTP